MKQKNQINSKSFTQEGALRRQAFVPLVGPERQFQAGELLQSFSESPLAVCRSEDITKAKQIIHSLKESRGLIFVFAMGGMGAAGRMTSPGSASKTVFHINALDENGLCILNTLTIEQLQNANWLFISKGGRTAENMFYLGWIKDLYFKKNLKLKKGQIRLLTKQPGSELGVAVKELEGSLLSMEGELPGRFSFFTLSGFLQAHLMGLKLEDFLKGFLEWRIFQKESEKILSFFLDFLKTGKKGFLLVDSTFLPLAQWFEASWAESLFKEDVKRIYPVRAFELSDIFHAYLEEVAFLRQEAFVLSLRRPSSVEPLNQWEKKREQALQTILKQREVSFLSFEFPVNQDFFRGYLMALFFQVIYGVGKTIKADIYSQPWVDSCKQLFPNE